MRSKQLILAVTLCAAVLSSAAYFALRPRPPHADSRDSSVVAATGAEKSTGKRAGNAPVQIPASVDRRGNLGDSFRALRQCFYASRELAAAKAAGDCKFYEAKPQFEQAYVECLNGSMDVRRRKSAAEAVLSECGDVSDVERHYYETTKAAAQQGDVDAQLCYLESDFGSDDTSVFTAADVAEYENTSPTYVGEAFERGDWRIVYLLAQRRFHPGSGQVTQLDKIGRPETVYRMTKLLRLGASGSYAKGLDGKLESLIRPDLRPKAGLPQDTVKEADAWAYETYVSFFSGVPGLTEAPVVCNRLPISR